VNRSVAAARWLVPTLVALTVLAGASGTAHADSATPSSSGGQYSLGQYGEIDSFGGFDASAYDSGSYGGALTSGEFVDPAGFAADAVDSNTLYVLDRVSESAVSVGDGGATSTWRMQQLSDAGTVKATSIVTLAAPSADSDSSDTFQLTGLTVDPTTGEVYSLVDKYDDADAANVPYELIAWSTGTINGSASALDTPTSGLSSEAAPSSAAAAPVTFTSVSGGTPGAVSYYDQITGGSSLGAAIYNPQGLAVDDQSSYDAVVIAAAGSTANYTLGADGSSTVVQQIHTSGSSIGAAGGSWSSGTNGFANPSLASSDEATLGPAGISSVPASDTLGAVTNGITVLLDNANSYYGDEYQGASGYGAAADVDVVDLSSDLGTATIVASQINAVTGMAWSSSVQDGYPDGTAIDTDGADPPYSVDGSGTDANTYNAAAGPQIVALSNGLYAADFSGSQETIGDPQSYNEADFWADGFGKPAGVTNEGVRLLDPEPASGVAPALTDPLSNTTAPLTSVYDTLGGTLANSGANAAGSGPCSIDYNGSSYAAGADGVLFVLTRGWASNYGSNDVQATGGRQIIEFGPTTAGGGDTALTPVSNSVDPDAGNCPDAQGTFGLYSYAAGSSTEKPSTNDDGSLNPLIVGVDTKVAFDAGAIEYPVNSFATALAVTTGSTTTYPPTATPFAFEWGSDDTQDAGSGNADAATDTFATSGVPDWPRPTGYTFTYTTPGTYKPTLTLLGDYGTDVQQGEVKVVAPPTAALKDSSITATAGQPVTLDASGSLTTDPTDDPIVDYDWTITGGSGSPVYKDTPAPTLVYTFPATGTYTVTLVGIDQLGQTSTNSATEKVNVVADAPTATLTASPTSATTGQSVSFTATATAGAGSSLAPMDTYSWDFGDGTSASTTTSTTSHVYSAAGTYTVKLTVADADGQKATSSATVTVTNPPSSPKPAPKPKLSPANVVLKAGVSSTTLTLQFKSVKVGSKLTVKLSEPKAKKAKTKSAKVGSSHLLKFGTGKLPAGATKIRFYETVGKGKHAKLKLVKTETVHVKAKKK